SSRRRHTRSKRDWSSDVCSSDLSGKSCHDRIFRILQGAFLGQNFDDTLCRFASHGDHNENHRQHHQAAEDLEAVGQHRGHLTDVDIHTAGGDDGVGTKSHNKDHDRIHTELHQRVVESQNTFSAGKIGADIFSSNAEFLLFLVLTDKGFDNAHTFDVFLNRAVEGIVLFEYAAEQRDGFTDDQCQTDSQNWNYQQEDTCQS